MVQQSYGEWQAEPLISIGSVPTPSNRISLPAVSVCGAWAPPPGTQALMKSLEQNQNTTKQRQQYLAAKTLCRQATYDDILRLKDYTSPWELAKMNVDVNYSVAVSGDTQDFCITFNLALKKGVRENKTKFQRWIKTDTRQEYGSDVGILGLLKISHFDSYDTDCGNFSIETNVIIHGPYDFPLALRWIVELQKGYRNRLHINADVMQTEEAVRDLPLSVRQCYFPGERTLHLFSEYTENNCLLECRIYTVIKEYGCRDADLPGPSHVSVCRETVPNIEFMPGKHTYAPCDCVDFCNGTKYEIVRLSPEGKIKNSTVLDIWFNQIAFTPKVRRVKSSFTGFLANCGGFLGVFLGISVLSVLEVLYHFLASFCRTNFTEEEWRCRMERKLEASHLQMTQMTAHVEILAREIRMRHSNIEFR